MELKLTANSFKESLKEGKFLGLRCKSCGAYYAATTKIVCDECGSDDLEVTELKKQGKIQTFSVMFVPPEAFKAPYIIAIVELDEGPWVMGNLEGIAPEEVTEDILNRRVSIAHKVVSPDELFAGERVALTFNLAD